MKEVSLTVIDDFLTYLPSFENLLPKYQILMFIETFHRFSPPQEKMEFNNKDQVLPNDPQEKHRIFIYSL